MNWYWLTSVVLFFILWFFVNCTNILLESSWSNLRGKLVCYFITIISLILFVFSVKSCISKQKEFIIKEYKKTITMGVNYEG